LDPDGKTYESVAKISDLNQFPPFFNMTVCKMGRTTGYTTGKIVDISSDFFIDYSAMFGNPPGTNRAFFVDRIKVDGGSRAFALRGDSGSLLLDTDSHPVGLVFASDLLRFGFCNHIGDVMSALSILRI
jgi:hypothetical protein